MDTQGLLIQLLQLALFSAFIHAIVEVFKGISANGVVGIIKNLFFAIFKNRPLDTETIHSLVFILALFYCKAFDFAAMTGILHVQIAETNMVAWWGDYIGTASVVYVGVDVFYSWIRKLQDNVKAQAANAG